MLIASLAVIGIFALFFLRDYQYKKPYAGEVGLLNPIPARLSSLHRKTLQQQFPFYRKLPPKSKEIFVKRVAYFIRLKNFVPRNMDKVTDEMKVLISATAIQLLFGHLYVHLKHFKNILIYPDDYYSTILKQYHKGEVNPRHKAIVLSWKSFVHGFAENEGVNLGLHEMAHAMHLENRIENAEFDFISRATFDHWAKLAEKEMFRVESGNSAFFRSYASMDRYEFFAVAVENFFERPIEFHDYNAELYLTLSEILNQDPKLLENEMV